MSSTPPLTPTLSDLDPSSSQSTDPTEECFVFQHNTEDWYDSLRCDHPDIVFDNFTGWETISRLTIMMCTPTTISSSSNRATMTAKASSRNMMPVTCKKQRSIAHSWRASKPDLPHPRVSDSNIMNGSIGLTSDRTRVGRAIEHGLCDLRCVRKPRCTKPAVLRPNDRLSAPHRIGNGSWYCKLSKPFN